MRQLPLSYHDTWPSLTEVGVSAKAGKGSATLLIAGDLCPAGRPSPALQSRAASEALWARIRPATEAADFSIVNLECPLTHRPRPLPKAGPRLWAAPECVTGVRASGFTAVTIANNHILDAGAQGVADTLQTCTDAGLGVVGAGPDIQAAERPLQATVNGLELVVLAFAEGEFSRASRHSPGAWPLDPVDNAGQIALARRSSDFVLVVLHTGSEHYRLPSPRQQRICRFFVEQGADAVICHHSHVPGGFEFHLGKPVVYGTGNLLFDWPCPESEYWYFGYLVQLTVAAHQVLDFRPIPYEQDPARPEVRLMSGEEEAAFLSDIACLSRVLADADQLEREWVDYCGHQMPSFIRSLLCLTRPEAWLLSRRLLPAARLRLRGPRLLRLLGLLSSPTLLECSEQSLRELLHEPGDLLAGSRRDRTA